MWPACDILVFFFLFLALSVDHCLKNIPQKFCDTNQSWIPGVYTKYLLPSCALPRHIPTAALYFYSVHPIHDQHLHQLKNKYVNFSIIFYEFFTRTRSNRASARFVGGWGFNPPLVPLNPPSLYWPSEKIVKISQKYIADPPLVFPKNRVLNCRR